GWARVPDATTFGRFLRRAAGVLVPVLDELLWHVCSGCAGGRWACRGASSLEIVLVETPLVLSGVQVTATPGGGAVWAASQATTELSGKALERNLGATLAETLQGTPGMAVRYSGPAAAAPVIRGLSGDRILVLQDGLRTGDLAGSAVDHTVTIDPLAASRV